MKYNDLPAHIRAAHTAEQRAYYQSVYAEPRFGPEWITAHRRLEMELADTDRRHFFLGYWPSEALHILESFRREHFDAEPHPTFSSVGDRLKRFYPNLFPMLDMRMGALGVAANSHPALLPIWKAYENLKASYFRKLAAAEELTNHLEGKQRRKQRHTYYLEAFAAIYPDLKSLIDSLIHLRN